MKKIHSFDEVHDSQQMFRLTLKAMSNPLQRFNIHALTEKLYGNNKAFLALAFTLVDNESSFYSFQNKILDDSIISLTLATVSDCQEADFIFVEGEKNLKFAIENGKCGTLSDPHKSATIIVKISNLKEYALNMYGPGIDGTITLQTDPLVKKGLEYREKMYFEYPQGIDLIFVDEDDNMFAIPRLVKEEGK
ncbi:phosphonate C-P lyase system protein PhnH [Anaerotignum sp.]|uniref:phosphonate C-P lyase system protein PhnH n=1 Tax=Anaerotignum sp. TaxID=2039241 RepID=UPI0028A61103|nr:phosphonate C-P lyase system protein PhnH [Anaerotignum sp.]